MEFVLGIDAGTSACKASLIGRDGAAVSATSDAYGYVSPRPEWAEQDPALWWNGAVQSVARAREAAGCSSVDIVAVGVTGQMHSAVLLGEDLEPVSPALLWCDQRAVSECARAERAFPAIREITLNPLLPAFTLSKLLWVRDHETAIYRRIRHVLLPKDFLRLRMTGQLATDPSDASGTSMFDARNWVWSTEILDALGIAPSWLPACFPSASTTGSLGASAAALLGLQPGTPVVAGAGDQAAQAIGLGATEPSVLVAQIGTSGVIVASSLRPVDGAFCHAAPGRWIRLNSLHAAGSSLTWARDAFAPGEDLADLLRAAGETTPGAAGLMFLPFLMGERSGYAASVPATLCGLRPDHRRGHLVRAVLEGVAYELRRMLDVWAVADREAQAGPEFPTEGQRHSEVAAVADGAAEVRLVGGGAKNGLWQQVLADIVDLPMAYVTRDSAYGAGVLAGIGIGWWESAPPLACATWVRPDGAHAATYRDGYQRYCALYAGFRAMTKLEGGRSSNDE
ncbi:MAG: FGGY family carbohydrate kinase [Candidatus Limnocylindrales bacterium]|jgi:xylulokinase